MPSLFIASCTPRLLGRPNRGTIDFPFLLFPCRGKVQREQRCSRPPVCGLACWPGKPTHFAKLCNVNGVAAHSNKCLASMSNRACEASNDCRWQACARSWRCTYRCSQPIIPASTQCPDAIAKRAKDAAICCLVLGAAFRSLEDLCLGLKS